MIIYKISDRIPVAIGKIKFWISPLTLEQKESLSRCTKLVSGEEKIDLFKLSVETVRCSVKGVEGLKLVDGSDYELEFTEDGSKLTDECVSELLQLDFAEKLSRVCASLVNEIKDHQIKGVKIDLKGVISGKK